MNENRPVDNLREVIHDFEGGRLTRRMFLNRVLLVGLSLPAAVALLEACSAGPATSPSQSVAVTTANPSASGQTAPASGLTPLRAAIVTPEKQGDLDGVDSSVAGLEKGASELGYETKVVEVVQGEYEEATRSLAADGYDLVIGLFPPMIDAITTVAKQHPDQHFGLVIAETETTLPNMVALAEYDVDACFLAAALGGLYTKSNITGSVQNLRDPELDRMLAGYQQGLAATNAKGKLLFNVLGGENPFGDPAGAKRLALLLNEQGADVVHGTGGASILGVHEAAAQSAGAFVSTGMDVDQCLLNADSTLCSVRIYEGDMVYRIMESLRNDQWKSGNVLAGIVDGGNDICTFDDSKPEGHLDPVTGHKIGPGLPAQVRDMIWNLRSQIVSGSLKLSTQVKE